MVWTNPFFYLFLGVTLLSMGVVATMVKALKKRTAEMKLLQQQHVARVDVIRKDNTEKLESVRVEMLKREEERSRQWMESEKETLHVLNGVSNLLELSDKVDKVEFKKINKILTDIENKIISEKKLMSQLQISEKKYRQLFENSIVAISVHDVILDQNGKPCDYRFLDVNQGFEEYTGLKGVNIIGKTCLEVLPDVEPYWIEIFGNVAVTGNPITFENYNRSTGKSYKVMAYAPEPNKFVALSIPVETKH
jgi:PAS domain S-box-containing protein